MVWGAGPVHLVVSVDRLEPAEELQGGVILGPEPLELAWVSGRKGEELQHVGSEEPRWVQHSQLA